MATGVASDPLAVSRQMAAGLARVHARGILHRDLKGDNLLVRREGDGWAVKLIDFGLALRREVVETSMARGSASRTVRDASVAGTLKFAAPEQLGELPGVRVGPASDVHGFGRTCYAALFGHPDPDDEEKGTLPDGWRQLLSRCTAKRPERRPQSFEEVVLRLDQIAAGTAHGPTAKPAPDARIESVDASEVRAW